MFQYLINMNFQVILHQKNHLIQANMEQLHPFYLRMSVRMMMSFFVMLGLMKTVESLPWKMQLMTVSKGQRKQHPLLVPGPGLIGSHQWIVTSLTWCLPMCTKGTNLMGSSANKHGWKWFHHSIKNLALSIVWRFLRIGTKLWEGNTI